MTAPPSNPQSGHCLSRRNWNRRKRGEAAVVGIRPSDIRFAAGGEAGFKANIAMLEPLGDVTVVSVETGGETLRMVLPESAAAGSAARPAGLGHSRSKQVPHLSFFERAGNDLTRGGREQKTANKTREET